MFIRNSILLFLPPSAAVRACQGLAQGAFHVPVR
jgi:hypothetical protein